MRRSRRCLTRWTLTTMGKAMPCHAMPCPVLPLRTVPYRAAPYRAVPYRAVPYRTAHSDPPYQWVPLRATGYHSVPCRTTPCRLCRQLNRDELRDGLKLLGVPPFLGTITTPPSHHPTMRPLHKKSRHFPRTTIPSKSASTPHPGNPNSQPPTPTHPLPLHPVSSPTSPRRSYHEGDRRRPHRNHQAGRVHRVVG